MVKKFDDMCTRVDTIPQLDRRTDGRTDRQNCYISIAHQYVDMQQKNTDRWQTRAFQPLQPAPGHCWWSEDERLDAETDTAVRRWSSSGWRSALCSSLSLTLRTWTQPDTLRHDIERHRLRLCVFIAFSYSLVTIMLVCRENIRTSLYNTSQDATWGIWWWSRVFLFSYSVGFDYRAVRTHKFVHIPTRPRKRSVTIQCWIRQSTFNEYISLVILECRNRYITLRCRGNGNRKKLLTDSVMSLKAQQ